jgi:hypothetical protein
MRPIVIVGLLLATAAGAETVPRDFGDQRLFTTPSERERLDTLRAQRSADAETEPEQERNPASQESQTAKPADPIELRGYIQRSDGPAAYWLNDSSSIDRSGLPDGVAIESGRLDGGSVIVTLPDGRKVRLEPGETWDPESGGVVESHKR